MKNLFERLTLVVFLAALTVFCVVLVAHLITLAIQLVGVTAL